MLLKFSYETSVIIIITALARESGGGCRLDYEGFRQLAGFFIRDRDYSCIGNFGMSKEVGF